MAVLLAATSFHCSCIFYVAKAFVLQMLQLSWNQNCDTSSDKPILQSNPKWLIILATSQILAPHYRMLVHSWPQMQWGFFWIRELGEVHNLPQLSYRACEVSSSLGMAAPHYAPDWVRFLHLWTRRGMYPNAPIPLRLWGFLPFLGPFLGSWCIPCCVNLKYSQSFFNWE
jgi:hypothetical protein